MAEERDSSFGQLLRRLRNQAGMTQEELAERASISARSVSDLERGTTLTTRKDTARLLADALRLTGSVREAFEDAARGRSPAAGFSVGGVAGAMRTMPRDIAAFTGRAVELRRLAEAATGSGAVVGIHAIGGMAGVGKTAFAIHAAHQLSDRFPDGQLFLPLHGHTPGQQAVAPADALASLLLTVGVAAQKIPADLDARAALWRDHLAGKRMLVVLDDAVGTEQVRPLLPGTAGSLVLVTSRRHLTALEGARAISLDVLPPDEAVLLLVRLADRPALAADDPAVGQMAELCGFLPLAIGMVARQLAHHASWTAADLAADLAAARDRLGLMTNEDLSVAAALDLSYADLTPGQQRLFCRLSLHPGTEIDAYAAAALDETDRSAARRNLDGLYDHYLVTEPARGRYRLHDLIREHARALAAAAEDTGPEAATLRLLDYYLHTVQAADQHLARRASAAAPDLDSRPPASVPDLSARADAVAWMEVERLNLHAVVSHAATHGRPGHAVAIAAALHGFLRTHGHWDQALALHQIALGLARQLGDQAAEASALADLGDMQYMTGDYAASADSLGQALEVCRAEGNLLGEAEALRLLSYVQFETGEMTAATASLHRVLDCFRQLGDRAEEAITLGALGVVQQAMGDYEAAMSTQEQALALHRELGNRTGEANALNYLGAVQQTAGQHAAAAANQERALVLHRELGNRFGEANALNWLGMARQSAGDFAAAAASQDEALQLYRELGHRMGEANVLNCIGQLNQATGEYAAAAASLEQALGLFRELGILQGEGEVLNSMGELALAAGEVGRARERHQQALALAERIDSRPEQVRALEGLGRCQVQPSERKTS